MASRAARSPRKPTSRKSSRADTRHGADSSTSTTSRRRSESTVVAATIKHNRELRQRTIPGDAATESVAVAIRFASRVLRRPDDVEW
ncbi:hypothetical protein ALC57_02052 [Trachymyrmex cornetzi]|uniref:Uncharacterized protein n=1 Tax=Trachymyrmex cornetzi TaxID=471704 RepID=A0A151JP31_9HYME|nr:hypothetical protein ALC57_02052 [Trachymyrmex cornetzi]